MEITTRLQLDLVNNQFECNEGIVVEKFTADPGNPTSPGFPGLPASPCERNIRNILHLFHYKAQS